MAGERIDLGHKHTMHFTSFRDMERFGAIVEHEMTEGHWCSGAITFDTPLAREAFPDNAFWQVVSWEPLTLTPSLLCHCGDHGFIRNGQWEPA